MFFFVFCILRSCCLARNSCGNVRHLCPNAVWWDNNIRILFIVFIVFIFVFFVVLFVVFFLCPQVFALQR